MIARYPATYRDAHGEEQTVIENDGKLLRMRIRGVACTGTTFDLLEIASGGHQADLSSFTLNRGELCNSHLEWDMPLTVVSGNEEITALLHVCLDLGSPLPNGSIDRDDLCMTLRIGAWSYTTATHSGWFEEPLAEIARALPEGTYMKMCHSCAYSGYFVGGNGMFGDMACFRDNKAAYLAARDKHDLIRLWDTRTEMVQETYLCPEFARRVPGSGYRG